MAIILRIIGIAMNAIGALLLAWRVKSIIDILVQAQNANDLNFRRLSNVINNPRLNEGIIVGMDEQLERRQKQGGWFLVFGFLFIALGNILIGLSWYIQ